MIMFLEVTQLEICSCAENSLEGDEGRNFSLLLSWLVVGLGKKSKYMGRS
jgi:hypothetical protein